MTTIILHPKTYAACRERGWIDEKGVILWDKISRDFIDDRKKNSKDSDNRVR
jgi:hypothetical protein